MPLPAPRRARLSVLVAGLSCLALTAVPAPALEDAQHSLQAEARQWLAGYLAIDTTNPPGNESAAAAYLSRILHAEGISTRLLVTPEGRTNLLARLEAGVPDAEAIVLLHHMDVVAAGEGWTRDPFGAEVSKNRIWGRGAVDAKSLGIAHLAAFVDAKRSGRPLTHDLVYLAVADEETGGSQGVGWLVRKHPEIFEPGVAAVLNEGGSNRILGDRLLWWGVEVAQKRPLWLRVKTQGRGGHGSSYNPNSASHRLLVGLGKLVSTLPEFRVTEPTRNYFEAVAGFHGQAFQDVFVAPTLEDVQRNFERLLADRNGPPVLLPGMLAYFQDTLQVTSLNASSETVNVVPEEVSALIDLRLLPDTRTEDVLERLREALGPSVEMEVLLRSPVTRPSSTQTSVYRAMEAVLGGEAPMVPALITGTTDSRYFRERGIPAYGFSPFLLSGEEARGIHGPNESIPLRKLDAGVLTMIEIVQAITSL